VSAIQPLAFHLVMGLTALPHALLQRAGGGHGFGGGGGGGARGGGISGGGGTPFVGGGGGGLGGASVIGLIFVFGFVGLLLVIVFALARRRGGGPVADGGPPPAYPHSDQPAFAPGSLPWDESQPAPQPTAGSLQEGVAAIQAHDPDFSLETFKSSVERSFFVVEEAWTELKPEMSRRVMADGIWQQHRSQIEGYAKAGTRNVLDGLAVGRVDVLQTSSDAQFDTIVVRILATCADYDINVANGKVVRGNKHEMAPWQEDWVFQRSSKATTKTDGGTMQQKCPNCGAPLDLDLAGVCKYCRAPVMSGEYDWVLTRIDQV